MDRPIFHRGRTHLATLTSSSHAESDSLLNSKQLVQGKGFSPSDTEDSHNTTHDDLFGLQSPGSPVTHHEGPCDY